MHTSTYKGKKVFVKLKDGTSFVAKFKDSKSGRIMFFDHDDVATKEMTSFNIFKNKTTKKKEAGFTLVEIAIVFAIMSLLIFLILKGSEMIANARVKNTIEQFRDVEATIELYRDRYHAFPGDDPNASRWAGAISGNGNGVLEGSYNANPSANQETTLFWLDLRMSKLIQDGKVPDAQQLNNNVGGRIGVQEGNNYLGLNGIIICGNVPAKVAIGMDSNMDDGKPNTGRIRAMSGDWTTPLSATPATSYVEDGGTYVVCMVANSLGR